jgi:hypothetical protein
MPKQQAGILFFRSKFLKRRGRFMKKLMLAALSAAFIVVSTAAFAAWNDDLSKLIKTGKYDQIGAVVAENPNDQGNIALFLLQAAQTKANGSTTENPDMCGAAKILQAALPMMSQVPSGQQDKANGMVSAIAGAAETAQNKDSNSCAAQLLAQLEEYDNALLAQQTLTPSNFLPGPPRPSAE